MNKIIVRDRILGDDIKSIRHQNTAVKNVDNISIPKKNEDHVIIWGDSVQRKLILKDDEILKSCLEWPKETKHKCHNCAHPFEGIPVPLPMSKDELRNIYYVSGNFCSWQCAKAFNLRETSPAGRGNRNMYISILAFKMWIKLLKDEPVNKQSVRTFCSYKINPARPRSELIDFGGRLSIEEYRKDFYGVLPPLDLIKETSPLLTLRKLAVVPFIDTNNVKKSTLMKTADNDGQFKGIKRIETNRVQEFNNSFCERLRKAKDDPNLMKRKKTRDDTNTLLSSMGIKIKKRSRLG